MPANYSRNLFQNTGSQHLKDATNKLNRLQYWTGDVLLWANSCGSTTVLAVNTGLRLAGFSWGGGGWGALIQTPSRTGCRMLRQSSISNWHLGRFHI